MTMRAWLLQTSAGRVSGSERIVPRLDTAFLGSSTRMGLYIHENSADADRNWMN